VFGKARTAAHKINLKTLSQDSSGGQSPSRRPGFTRVQVRVGFMVHKVALRYHSSEPFSSPLSEYFYQCTILIYSSITDVAQRT